MTAAGDMLEVHFPNGKEVPPVVAQLFLERIDM